ncbi:MAG: response regulator [Lachnospiraceae bacterium]|nr:response regulator [Lachnospiraceae bacterium]
MNKKSIYDRYRTVSVVVFFGLALLVVGMVLRTRMGMFVQSYTELQTKKQAESYAMLMSEKLTTELENLEYIAGQLEASLDDMDDLMPRIYSESGMTQGLLSIDGEALYGESLNFSEFEGIQSSFRGNNAITYVRDKGLLFTCPVFNGPNIRYVLYRLCPMDALEERFATDIFDDLGKLCVTTRNGNIVVPFINSTIEDMQWYESEEIQSWYGAMHLEMEVSVAAAKSVTTDRGDMLLFESEIPGTDFLISGYVPRSVAAEGIENLTQLVVWVFGLLMLLVLIGAFYLTRVSVKIRESDELREAKAVAEEASRAKSDFLANMSHEIRTPINAVLGMNEMILRESSDDAITTYASNIRTAGNSLLGIINDILDFSKIEAGKIEIIPVEYSLPSVISDLVNMIRSRADDKGIHLQTEFDPGLPRGLFGDEVRIKQIITNLLSNAVKYTEKGTVTFGMGYEDTEDAEFILLKVYVKDTGIGIKQEDIEKLYLEFTRIEEKRNRNIEGTGLGMSITKNLLQMMDSELKVESVYGEGSTFSFSVKQRVTDRQPLGDYEFSVRQQLADMKKYRESFKAPDARVLVVDDNDMNLMVFKSLIKQTGVQTVTADSGDEGIALTMKEHYDLIFLDHMMPVKDGIETLREIRENAENPNRNTPTICLTANAISGAKEEYMAAGFDDYISKPIDPDRLEELMMALLPEGLVMKQSTGEFGTEEEAGDLPAELKALAGGPIDVNEGLKNSGTADSYVSLLKIFYDSIPQKAEEINGFYERDAVKDYTIKVHALKSSARIIGAAELGEQAQELENAGKSGDTGYIRSHHEEFMSEYLKFRELLSPLFPEDVGNSRRPEAGADLMALVMEEIRTAAADMDCDRLEDIFDEMGAYSIPEDSRELYEKLKAAADEYDYEKIKELLG